MPGNLTYQQTIVGYYGCDRTVGERVLLGNGTLKASNNDDDWLGTGIYFWEHGPQRALEFAEWKHRRGEIESPFVLGAYIHLGQCFDLTDTVATGLAGTYYHAMELKLAGSGLPMPENRPAGNQDFDLVLRRLDCAVLNCTLSALASMGMSHDTVRGVFPGGGAGLPQREDPHQDPCANRRSQPGLHRGLRSSSLRRPHVRGAQPRQARQAYDPRTGAHEQRR